MTQKTQKVLMVIATVLACLVPAGAMLALVLLVL